MISLWDKYHYLHFTDEEIESSEKLNDLLRSNSKFKVNLKYEDVSDFTAYSMHCFHIFFWHKV